MGSWHQRGNSALFQGFFATGWSDVGVPLVTGLGGIIVGALIAVVNKTLDRRNEDARIAIEGLRTLVTTLQEASRLDTAEKEELRREISQLRSDMRSESARLRTRIVRLERQLREANLQPAEDTES